jgi:hypothetical protein
VTGPAGGTWTCTHTPNRWALQRQASANQIARLELDADTPGGCAPAASPPTRQSDEPASKAISDSPRQLSRSCRSSGRHDHRRSQGPRPAWLRCRVLALPGRRRRRRPLPSLAGRTPRAPSHWRQRARPGLWLRDPGGPIACQRPLRGHRHGTSATSRSTAPAGWCPRRSSCTPTSPRSRSLPGPSTRSSPSTCSSICRSRTSRCCLVVSPPGCDPRVGCWPRSPIASRGPAPRRLAGRPGADVVEPRRCSDVSGLDTGSRLARDGPGGHPRRAGSPVLGSETSNYRRWSRHSDS